jgi:4-hydroxybenzoate polyprenyltransferase
MATDKRTTLGGKRKLTLIDTIAQSVGLMGPVFSIAFLVPLVVGLSSASGNGAGNAASLAVVIAAVGLSPSTRERFSARGRSTTT